MHMDTTRRMDAPMTKTLRFVRPGARFDVPEVTVSLNTGWTLKESGHRAIVTFPEGVRINGALLTDVKQQKALKAVVFAVAAFNDAGDEYDALIRSETEAGAVKIFAEDLDERSNMSSRRALEQATSKLEMLVVVTSESFLALYQGRHPNDLAFTCLGALAESFLGDDDKRDVYVQ